MRTKGIRSSPATVSSGLGEARTAAVQGELACRAARRVRNRPQAAVVRLHDRAADRKAHPHPVSLGREERVEDPFGIVGGTPTPVSEIETTTPAGGCGSARTSNSLGSPALAIACTAFAIKLSSTCWSCTRSPGTTGTWVLESTRTWIRCLWRSSRSRASASRMTSLTSRPWRGRLPPAALDR